MRGLIEIKYISNTQFAHGAETQLPIYLKGEHTQFGVYVCVGYRDRDFDSDRLTRVRDACKSLSGQGNITIVPVFVDARAKPSASKA